MFCFPFIKETILQYSTKKKNHFIFFYDFNIYIYIYIYIYNFFFFFFLGERKYTEDQTWGFYCFESCTGIFILRINIFNIYHFLRFSDEPKTYLSLGFYRFKFGIFFTILAWIERIFKIFIYNTPNDQPFNVNGLVQSLQVVVEEGKREVCLRGILKKNPHPLS